MVIASWKGVNKFKRVCQFRFEWSLLKVLIWAMVIPNQALFGMMELGKYI